MGKKLTVLLIILPLMHLSAQSNQKMVICGENNAICTLLDTLSDRKPMSQNVVDLFNHYYSTDTSMIDQVFEIKYEPYSLLVIHIVKVIDWDEEYHFWVYDSCTNSSSTYPFIINGQWMSNQEEGFDIKLLSYPIVFDENNFLWVKERVHNGNSYNAVIKYKLYCDKKFNLRLVSCVEEVSLCFFPEMDFEDYALFYREQDGKEVVCYIKNTSGESELVGSFSLSKRGKISKIKVYNERYSSFLVTSSGLRPQAFTKRSFREHEYRRHFKFNTKRINATNH